jgi:hypothetical protein
MDVPDTGRIRTLEAIEKQKVQARMKVEFPHRL